MGCSQRAFRATLPDPARQASSLEVALTGAAAGQQHADAEAAAAWQAAEAAEGGAAEATREAGQLAACAAQACLATDLALVLLASGEPQLADDNLPAGGSQLLPDMLRVC